MDLSTFLRQRRPEWKRLEAFLRRVEGSGLGILAEEEAVEFGRLYRRTASDLNQAQTFVTGDATVRYLNELVARCYLIIYARTQVNLLGFLGFLVWGYPTVFRRYARHVLIAACCFTAGCALGFGASFLDAETARSYLLPADFPTIQPGDQHERAQTSGELAAFSGFLFRNNMTVTLIAFALGITFGIGTAWILFSNGILTGALAAVFLEAGEFVKFCTGILPHGVIEIPAILIGGGAGFLLAEGMIYARAWPRREEVPQKGIQALLLVTGTFPLLVAAALLEAMVARAPDWYLTAGVKLTCAGMVAGAFLVYLVVFGRKVKQTAAEELEASPWLEPIRGS